MSNEPGRATIRTGTLVMAIQAVSRELKALNLAVDDDDAEGLQAIEDWQAAADDLQRAYDAAARLQINLPPYDELVA